MMRDLPQILFGLQVILYIVLILVFGSIIVKGYRGYAHFAIKLLMRLGFGFVALVCGIAISGIIPMFSNESMYNLIQVMIINPFLGMVVSAFVLTVSIYLISHNIFNVPGIKKQIEKLQNKLKKAEEILSKPVKKLDPIRIAGVVILIVFLIISLLNFHGFPSLGDDMFKFIGLTPDDVKDLSDYMQGLGIGGDVPEGCASTLILIQNNLDDFIAGILPESSDQGIRSLLESGSGTAMIDVYEVIHEGTDMFVGISSDGNNVCSATSSRFCECIDLKSVMPQA
jgi:hypothetical protein